MNNRREVEIFKRKMKMVKGEKVFEGEDLLHVGPAFLTTISAKDKVVLGAKFEDAELKIFVDYITGVDESCSVRIDGVTYKVIEVTNNGFMNRVIGIVLKR